MNQIIHHQKTKNMKNVFFLILVLFTSISSLAASNEMRAWVWANQPTTEKYTPNKNYQFNSASSKDISVSRFAPGTYEVNIPGGAIHKYGVAQATSYGSNATAQVEGWGDMGTSVIIRVKLYNPNGQLTDSKFVLFFYEEDRVSRRINSAYQWMNDPVALSDEYTFNSKGLKNTVKKIGTGRYEVTFPSMKANSQTPGQKGNVQVTPYGDHFRRAKVVSWGGHDGKKVKTIIQLYNANGQPADGQFVVSYISDFGIGQAEYGEDPDYGAYVWAGNPTAANYTPTLAYQDINTSPQAITIQKTGTGTYRVKLPKIINYKSTMAIASAYGSGATYCTILGWSLNSSDDTIVTVRCYNAAGIPTNSKFTLFYYTDKNVLF